MPARSRYPKRLFLTIASGLILYVCLCLAKGDGNPIPERNDRMFEALEPRMLMSVGALGSNTVILDNGESGFETSGSWNQVSNGYEGDMVESSSGSATWTFDNLDPGYEYRLSVTWADGSGRTSEAQYKIIDHEQDGRDTTLSTIKLDQNKTPSDLTDDGVAWEDLGGPHLVRGTSLSVELTAAGGKAVADAVRLERVGEWVAPTGIVTPEFGIEESHWMYAESGQTYDYGNGPEAYRMSEDGPYTHYVDNTHSNATDSGNPYGTPDKPRKTIPTNVKAGSVVEIHGGSYNTATSNSKIMLAGVGSADKPIFYRGAENDSMPRLNVLTTLGHYDEGRWIIVENLSMSSGEVRGNNDHVAFRNNVFSNGGGLRISGDTSSEWIYDLVIYNNTFHDNGDWQSGSENDVHGITVNMYNKDVWILDNHGYHHGGDSVQVNSRGSWTTENTYIGRNVFHHDRENAVDLKTLENCIVSENRMYGYRHTSTSEGAAFVVHYNPDWVWALNNEIYDSEYGMVNTGANDAYFLGNLIYDIHSHGYGNPTSAYDPGIAIHSRNSAALHVANNTLYDYGTGIAAPNAVIHVKNNILSDRDSSGGYDLNFPNSGISASSQMENNLLHNDGQLRIKWAQDYSSLDAFKSGSGKGDGSISADPEFVNPGNEDFRLSADSPAVDAGQSYDGYANLFKSRYGLDINVDLEDNPRLFGSAVDIGALELAGDTPPAANEAPVVNGGSYQIDEDKVLAGTVTGSDPDGDAVTFAVHQQPGSGTVIMNADGSFTYEPNADWYGNDTFTFTASDGWYDSAPATVNIAVKAVNDAPALEPVELTTLRQTALNGQLVAEDAEGQPVTFAVADQPDHGQLDFNADGSFTYIPADGWAGTDTFAVTASDGEAVTDPVEIKVMVGTPALSVGQGSLSFGSTTKQLSLGVTNSGEALLDYSVTTSAPWLTVSPADGTSTGETDTLTVDVDRTGLALGEHSATITVDGGAGGTVEIPVTLNVPTVVDETWVDVGDTWAYRKGTSAPAAEWNTQGFDDSGWTTGPSGIGYSSDVTHPTELGDMQDSYLSFFARKTFNVDDPNAVTQLDLGMSYDDGFVAYINGVEVARSESMGGNMGDAVAWDDPAASSHDEMDPEETFVLEIGPGLLTAGENTLAIEVHNVVETSSDALMAPRLTAKVLDDDTPVTGSVTVDTTELAFGEETKQLTFNVGTTGTEPVDYTVTSSASWLTVAPAEGQTAGEADAITVSVNRKALTVGDHTAVITVDAGDAGTRQVQVSASVAAGPSVEEAWVAVGDTWSYLKGDAAPPAEWAELGFDDSSWLTGPSSLGYSSDTTYETDLGDMQDGYMTIFARKDFQVDDPAAVTSLDLGMVYDDGFIAYINGVEVARSASMGGTPGVPVAYDYRAPEMHDEMDPEEVFTLDIPAGLLQQGTNTLAIEVHNTGLGSSDAVMSPRLTAMVADDGKGEPVSPDFTGDGFVDASDIDAITTAIRGASTDPAFDLTGDGQVDQADADSLVREVLETQFGDTNLDGRVNLTDFVQIKMNLGLADASWADGDISGDGKVDLNDFTVLKENFGFVSSAPVVNPTIDQVAGDSDIVDVLDLTPVIDPLA